MTDPRRSERLKGRAVQTKEPVKDEETRLRSGSHWDLHELNLLGAYFHPLHVENNLPGLAVDPEWTPSQRQGIARCHVEQSS